MECITAPQQDRKRQYLTSTQDLLARFHLIPAYDKYVRPHIAPLDATAATPHDNNPTTPTTDKGKGKEREKEREKDKDQDEDDEDGGATKKKKDTYKHLIKGVPGAYPFLYSLSISCIFPPVSIFPIFISVFTMPPKADPLC